MSSASMDQGTKGRAFRALHGRREAFIIPNPWDVGSARLLAGLGFEALATTSAGFAFSLGRPDNAVTRDQTLAHIEALARATDLPLSADLENGFGDAPEAVGETIRLAAQAGAVGGSIEDATQRIHDPVYDCDAARERVRAAANSARALPFPFTLTARCENYLVGRKNLADTIARLQAYQEAGADVLYAPGLTRREEIAEVVRSLDRPVNVLMGLAGVSMSLRELSAMGVRRVSVGSALARTALGAFHRAAEEMKDRGTFAFAAEAMSHKDLCGRFGSGGDPRPVG
jgi:2-methylisocitrate lyase-like PEP mutase family enzyme